jgi:hypothetical protein
VERNGKLCSITTVHLHCSHAVRTFRRGEGGVDFARACASLCPIGEPKRAMNAYLGTVWRKPTHTVPCRTKPEACRCWRATLTTVNLALRPCGKKIQGVAVVCLTFLSCKACCFDEQHLKLDPQLARQLN